jgi:NADH-quinone oxidoreductase subunit C
MSSSNENDKQAPEAGAASDAPEIKANPKVEAKTEVAEAPPISLGQYGQFLMANGFSPTALGNDAVGIEMIGIKANELLAVAQCLRDNNAAQFDLLLSVSGVDWKDRLEAVYHLYSTRTFHKMLLKVTALDEKVPSVVSVWQTADWHERETYDLFGIVFEGHPNLKRILMPSDWIGYPLRKDYKMDDPRLVWNER